MNAEAAELKLKSLKWNMNKSSLGQFTNTFYSLLNTVKRGNLPFDANKVPHTWIQTMPTHSALNSIKQALWNSTTALPAEWMNATGPLALSQVTSSTLLASGVSESTFNDIRPSPKNGRPNETDRTQRPELPRFKPPQGFSSIREYQNHMEKLVKDGWTCEKLETEYKDPFLKEHPNYDGCFVCRFKPPKTSHKDCDCNLLKNGFHLIPTLLNIVLAACVEEASGLNGSVIGKPHTEAMVEMRARRRDGQVFALMRRFVRVERWMDL